MSKLVGSTLTDALPESSSDEGPHQSPATENSAPWLSEAYCAGAAPAATAFAMSIVGNWADAEDIVQEAFCRLIRQHEQSGGTKPRSSRALMLTTVRNLAIDSLRAKRRQSAEPVEVSELSDRRSSGNDVRLQELERAIPELLQKVSAEWSQALTLKVNAKLSYEEIGEVMNASKGQVGVWIYRARKHLGSELQKLGLMD